jgi:alkylation response protein AidB-like acyl-CoA dehydrogenase
MRLETTPEELAFRTEVREWLNGNVPRTARPRSGTELRELDLAWQHRQFEQGWAGISWPKEYGGRGLSLAEQLIWYEECARADAPLGGSLFVALSHAGPTLIARGDASQKAFHLPRILKGEAVWCQGFSEPNAGSDLAGIKTQARVDGDMLVVNGSKIWTSYAYIADYQELLVRTDATLGRHKGLTWVICDMHAPGVTVTRIATMSGTGNLCQVFYDNVRIPLTNVIGKLGEGWNVAMTTLGFERGTAFINQQIALASTVDKLLALSIETGALEDGAIATGLATLRAEVAALRAMTYLSVSRGSIQDVPGPEGNMIALYYAELSKRVYALAMELAGPDGSIGSGARQDWHTDYLDAFKNTIAGGSSQIRLNVIGERVLSLPRGR